MEDLKEIALSEYFKAVSTHQPVPEAIAIRMKDGKIFSAGSTAVLDTDGKIISRLSARVALFNKLEGAYGEALTDPNKQPIVSERVKVLYNKKNPRDPQIEFS